MSRVIVRPLKTGGGGAALTVASLFFTGPTNVALVPQSLAPSGGTAPYTFSAVGLPAGVAINPATGSISGTPTAAGATTATATVTDFAGTMVNVSVFFSTIGITFFSDTFLGGANTLGLGVNYLSGPSDNGTYQMLSSDTFSRSGTAMVIQATSVNQNQTYPIVFWPRVLVDTVQFNQFAEITCVSDNSLLAVGQLQGGLTVLSGWQSNTDAYRSYEICWQGPDTSAESKPMAIVSLQRNCSNEPCEWTNRHTYGRSDVASRSRRSMWETQRSRFL